MQEKTNMQKQPKLPDKKIDTPSPNTTPANNHQLKKCLHLPRGYGENPLLSKMERATFA